MRRREETVRATEREGDIRLPVTLLETFLHFRWHGLRRDQRDKLSVDLE